jgi:hypothetical protein
MDEKVTLSAQLEENVSSVILLNKFTVKPEDVDEFLKVFSTTTDSSNSNLASSQLSCTEVLLAVPYSSIM